MTGAADGGQLWLDATRARRGGADLAAAGAAVTARRVEAGDGIVSASAQQPWGRDDIGAAFERSYRGCEQVVLRAWEGVGDHLSALGADVVRSVDANAATDAVAADRLSRVTDQR